MKMRQEDCFEVVKEAWNDSVYGRTDKVPIKKGLDRCKVQLIRWSKGFYDIRKMIIEQK